MESRCSCKLCKTADSILDFARCHHHKICELVDDNEDLRQFFQSFFRRKCLIDFFDALIIGFQVTYARIFRELVIAVIHFLNGPVQSARRFLRVCNDRNQKMRYAVVNLELYDFRVDHKHSDFIRCGLQENTHDKCIDAYGLTRTGSAGDQQMRHFRDI